MRRIFIAFMAAALMSQPLGVVTFAQEGSSPDPDMVISVTDMEPSDGGDRDSAIQKYIHSMGDVKPMPTDIETINENGVVLTIKTYEVPPDFDPEKLVEESFRQNGYQYEKRDLLRVEEKFTTERKRASKTVSIEHEERAGVLAKFLPILDYSQDGFEGQLELDPEAIATEAVGSQSYSYTITDTREYTGFTRNDTYGIPKTVTKNGVTLTLTDVDWQGMGAYQVEGGQAASGSYTAVAHYSGAAIGSRTSGYVSTGIYKGEVEKKTLSGVVYAVVYEGAQIPLPPIPPNYIPLFIGIGVILAAAAIVLLWTYRKNARIYVLHDGKLFLVKKTRIDYNNPEIDLSDLECAAAENVFDIIVDKYASRHLNNRTIRIIRQGLDTVEHRLEYDSISGRSEIQVIYSPKTDVWDEIPIIDDVNLEQGQEPVQGSAG